ncbi:MAG: glutathione synthase [Coxiella sp. (in: Bacteria)]|nr:MAG: glutathione synthase [Coxiella sp. (in: g-proteobacteria)]
MKLGIIMDPIEDIEIEQDTTFALMLEAQSRDHEIFYMEPDAIWLQDGLIWGRMSPIEVMDDEDEWFTLGDELSQPLVELDAVMMRKDPPFDMDYIYITYLLEQAESQGLVVVNKPQSLRDANEKFYTAWFPQCCPKTLVTSDMDLISDFLDDEEQIIVKPLDNKGGGSIFMLEAGDINTNVILETVTDEGSKLVMAQHYIQAIEETGDKRILMIYGKPIPYALARIPAEDDFRGNISRDATTQGCELTDRDRWLCEQVGPTLVKKGLNFVGLDVIGDFLTEINVTSPTGVRELENCFDVNICGEFFDKLEAELE